MKKRLFVLMLLLCIFLLIGCKTNNTIHNESYDVNINIESINEAFVPASIKGKEAVVGVSLYSRNSVTRSWYIEATGSGVIYKGLAYLKDGSTKEVAETKDSDDVKYYEYYCLTNAHVVNSNAKYKEVKIYLSRIDTLVSAELVGINAYEDLAVVKFTTSIYIAPLEFAKNKIQVGEIVLAIGNPLGYDYASTVTMGIVSNDERYLDVSRDFSDVRDIVVAYKLVVNSEDDSIVYNVGSGIAYSLKDMLEYITSLSKQNITVVVDEDKYRPVDNKIICCDNTKIRNELGWAPQYSIKDTLKEMFDYYLNQ